MNLLSILCISIMQIIAMLHTVQEVGNVKNRKGVNDKFYLSIYAINLLSLCAYDMKYFFPFLSFFLYEKINFSVIV